MGSLESDTTEQLHFHFSLSCIGEGNGTPLQCSCLENPGDGGAWWAAVYGVTQSRTRLKRHSSSSRGYGNLVWLIFTVLFQVGKIFYNFLPSTLYFSVLLHSGLQGQICQLLQVFLDFLLLHSSPLLWKGHLFGVLILEGLEVFIEPLNFSFFSITCQGIDLDYHDIEWFALETNRDHSVVFEIASKYCISDSFVD